ncbi:hypothetical protein JMJ77_0010288 [Colletotrichum scovillei]|uniref:Uncharacterized protein n=1 Tax=Colletotrichum scovillei TaxID=1209932 RepID=A0A9P7QXF7_9PEZI|nr:hypothetical protein JMJ78_0011665 [Colletotrichum scovillei]KAG7042186.1 hypothetical protein JMJ77_0010288 [Colletotrichum scovillei]KAG7062219.1 hypothetical protein JMJ76_0006496 [Colletotrichum scovillei]
MTDLIFRAAMRVSWASQNKRIGQGAVGQVSGNRDSIMIDHRCHQQHRYRRISLSVLARSICWACRGEC